MNIPAKKMGVLLFPSCFSPSCFSPFLLLFHLILFRNHEGAESGKCNKDDSGKKGDSPGTELSINFSV